MISLRGGLGLNGGSGGGGSPTPVQPAFDLELRGEDINYSGGLSTTWANASGGPIVLQSLIAGAEATTGGKVLNGFSSPLFPTRGALLQFNGTVKPGSFTQVSTSFLYTPDWDVGSGDRAYVWEYSNNTASADQHIAGGIANIQGFLSYGLAYSSTWNSVTDRPVARTCLITMVLEIDGSLSVYRNKALLCNVPGTIPSPLHTATYLGIGASNPNGINPTEAFRGSLHWYAQTWGESWDASDVEAIYDTQKAKYDWSESQWAAQGMMNAGLVVESQAKRTTGGSVYFGTNLAEHQGLTITTTAKLVQGTAAFQPSEGPRVNGYPTDSYDGVDDWMAGSALAPDNLNASNYEILWPFFPTGGISNVADATALLTPYNLTSFLADQAGFYGNALNVNPGTGLIDFLPWHWQGGPGVGIAPVRGQVNLNQWNLAHVWYQNVAGVGTLNARINAGAVVSVSPILPISNTNFPLLVGTGLLAQPTRFTGYMSTYWTFTGVLNASNRIHARNLCAERFGMAV